MHRILVLSGVNGQAEALLRLKAVVRDRQPDGVLFAGGILPPGRECASTRTSDIGYTREEVTFVEQFFSTIGELGVFTAVIPGVFDCPLDQFLQIGMKTEIEYPNVHLVHVTPVVRGDIAVFGLGACITDHTSTDIGFYSQTLAEYYLRPVLTAQQSRKILLLSAMPEAWEGDFANNRLAEALISSYHPAVCVLDGPGVKRRVERIAGILVIHPGDLAERYAAWLDWEQPGHEQAELLDLRQAAGQREVATVN